MLRIVDLMCFLEYWGMLPEKLLSIISKELVWLKMKLLKQVEIALGK